MHEKMQEEGVKVGYSTVKDYISQIKKRENIFIRIHTIPAEEAQVDFGYQYVKIDNLKSAILQANFYEPIYQELYKNFASHYGFHPLPCRIRRTNDKGKVESWIKYVKYNFFLERKFSGEKDLKERLFKWYTRANHRIHCTTRKVPQEVFEKEEKAKLISLPQEEFKLVKVGTRKVYHDCHIYVDYNYYSVPFEYVGKEVEIELSKNLLKVFYQGKEIALHSRLSDRGKFSTNNSHYPAYKRHSDTEYQENYQAKMAGIGNYTEQLFFLIIKEHPQDRK